MRLQRQEAGQALCRQDSDWPAARAPCNISAARRARHGARHRAGSSDIHTDIHTDRQGDRETANSHHHGAAQLVSIDICSGDGGSPPWSAHVVDDNSRVVEGALPRSGEIISGSVVAGVARIATHAIVQSRSRWLIWTRRRRVPGGDLGLVEARRPI